MLRECGKSLLKPWFSVANVCIFLAVLFLVCLIFRVYEFSKSDIAAWVQAVGSILAIVYSVRVANRQHQRTIELRAKDDVSQGVRLIGYAGHVMGLMGDTMQSIDSFNDELQDVHRRLRLLQDTHKVLSEVGLDSIRNLDLCIEWIQLRHALFAFISEIEKHQKIHDMKHSPSLRAAYSAAEKCMSQMFKVADSL